MIERPKLVLLLTALAVVGLAILYAYASSIGPLETSISHIGAEHEGKLVEITGMVTEASTLKSGDVLLTLADLENPGTIKIFVGEDIMEDTESILPGYILQASGVVESYNGEYEIVPSSSDDIQILEKGGTISPSPTVLLDDPGIFDGITVRVAGKIDQTWNDTCNWTILDLHDDKQVVVKCIVRPLLESEYVAEGVVSYDKDHGWWYLDETVAGKQ